ncbi:MAG: hypothetical protein JNK43_07380 [Ignavibacteria bacterium]|nr:hypothetical protein [Ignavibacteria bacterium]
MKTKLYTLIIISGLISLICLNCDEEKTQLPTVYDPPPAACETYNTARVFFQNRSNSGKSYDVIWDGSRVYTIAPGMQSDTMTVAAQIEHTLVFQISGTNTPACTQSQPILAKCSVHWYWCDN